MNMSPTKIILMEEERLGHLRIRDISLENSVTDYDYILKNSLYFKNLNQNFRHEAILVFNNNGV